MAGGILVVSLLSLFFAAGFSQQQTANILLTDQKLGKRALWKAKLHGKSLIEELDKRSTSIGKLSAYNTQLLVEFLKSIDADASREFATKLSVSSNFRTSLIGVAVLAHIDGVGAKLDLVRFLQEVVCTIHPALDPRPAFSTDDVFLAIDALVRISKIDRKCLEKLIDTPGYSPKVVNAARQALNAQP